MKHVNWNGDPIDLDDDKNLCLTCRQNEGTEKDPQGDWICKECKEEGICTCSRCEKEIWYPASHQLDGKNYCNDCLVTIAKIIVKKWNDDLDNLEAKIL